ncbi:hypothetical protein CLV59_107365 [Chitinophaga dinghuensis]|uniref:Uncharacterized protein n=1 Tax=Chitinophaga dinghuensis TaxID=1539050 RepID=A0A327VUH7_9BACT|nr:hypothetical protein [Chitinophaga dinghuensis]RAJ77598.1 hypothetical protein CLV59_107365 [Chitinophaga dinghuensis]
METSINLSDTLVATKTGDEKYKAVLQSAKVAVGSLSLIVYAVERGIRYGDIPADLSGVDAALNAGGPVERFKEEIAIPAKIIKAISYGIMAMTFFDAIFDYMDSTKKEVVFLGIPLTKVWRRTVMYIVIACVGIPMGLLYYFKLHGAASDAAKRWEKQISVITNLGQCFYGIGQLIFWIKNPEIFKNKKVFMGCNITNNITSVVEISGVDVVLYSADLGIAAGAGYIVVYSARTVIKTGEVVGLAIAD